MILAGGRRFLVSLFRRVVAPISVVATLALGGSAGTYVVRSGDTLTAIAGRLGVPVGALAKANNITDPNRVFVGQALTVPGTTASAPAPNPAAAARTHTVAVGDTLSSIATRYSTSVPAVVQLNQIDDPNNVRIGRRLRIPGAVADVASGSGLPARLRASPTRLALIPRFQQWSVANGLDPGLVMAVAWQESGWQNSVVSPAGAIGIGQLLPSTATFVGRDLIGVALNPNVPDDNIRLTARYLRWLLVRTNGNLDLALAGYYQGLASVASIGFLPTTVDYIAIVKALQPRFQQA